MYIEEWIKKFLDGKTPEEAGISNEDYKRLLACFEMGKDPRMLHFDSLAMCACNICRS